MDVNALPSSSALVRTWFGDDSAWEALVREVRTPSEEGFLAQIVLVNDPVFEGLTAEELRVKQTDKTIVSFLADETTFATVEHPILAVWVPSRDDTDRTDYRPFRVVPAELWGVENNINLANMDWEDFARSVDEDGVFRDF